MLFVHIVREWVADDYFLVRLVSAMTNKVNVASIATAVERSRLSPPRVLPVLEVSLLQAFASIFRAS